MAHLFIGELQEKAVNSSCGIVLIFRRGLYCRQSRVHSLSPPAGIDSESPDRKYTAQQDRRAQGRKKNARFNAVALLPRIKTGDQLFHTGIKRRRMFPYAQDLLPDLGRGGITLFRVHMRGASYDPCCVHIVGQHPLDQFPESENIRPHV